MPRSETSSSSSDDASRSGGSLSNEASTAASDADEPDHGTGVQGKVRPECLAWFREVIGNIKGQKQRPGLERIMSGLKKFQPQCTDKEIASNSDKFNHFIKQQLHFAISQGYLFKVFSNDMPSYKDTDNLKHLRKYTVNVDKEVRKAVTHALREIGDRTGTVEKDVVDYISYTFTVGVERQQLQTMVAKALIALSVKKELIQNPKDPLRFISKHLNKSDHDGEGTSGRRSVMSASPLPRASEEPPPKSGKKVKKKSSAKEETPMSSIADSKPSTSSSGTKSSGSSGSKAAAKQEKPRPRPVLEHSPEIELIEKKVIEVAPVKLDKKKKRDSDASLAHSLEIPEKISPPKMSAGSSAAKAKPAAPAGPKVSKLAEAMAKPSKKDIPITVVEPEKVAPVKTKKGDESRVKSPKPSTSKKETVEKEELPEKKKRGRPPLKKGEKGGSTERRKPKQSKSPISRPNSSESNPTSTTTFTPVFDVGPPPKELQDHLTKFFTPTSARRSRTSQLSLAVTASQKAPPAATTSKKQPVTTSDSERDESKSKSKEKTTRVGKNPKSPPRRKIATTAVKKEEEDEELIEDTETGTDGHEGGTTSDDGDGRQKRKKHGSQQLKGLQDGLSGYFKATDGERKRKPPTNFTPVTNKYGQAKRGFAALSDAVKGSSAGDQSETQSDEEEEADGEGEEVAEEDESGSDSEEEEEEEEEEKDDVKSRSTSRAGKHVFKMPDKIPKSMENLFRKARQRALEKVPTVDEEYDGPLPPRVQLGDKKIVTWYTSPFPEEYIRCECLYLCEFCLQYMKTVRVLKSHYEKCPWHRPPGTEIYHDTVDISATERQELIVYETDGNDWKEYCQNLCLLAKLYLDHKTLYYDVEPFLFYVLTRRDKYGDHLIGYFSKEKNSPQRYNVSCIMVLPPYQGGGYGRYLIDFSYLLSRVEELHGTPEKPLSELGQHSYRAYWKSAVLDFFLDQRQKSATKTSIKAICDTTGMWPQDVADTLQELGFIRKNEETKAWEFSLLQDVLVAYVEKKNSSKKRLTIVLEKLHWEPWRGDGLGVTTTESERSGSRAEQPGTGDERRPDGNPSGDTSESELDQPMEANQPVTPEPTSPPVIRPASRRSRGGTPRGRPGPRESSSRDGSASRQPRAPPPVLPSVKRRGRPPKVDRRRKDHARDGDTTAASRRKRKGKFRSRRPSSSAKPTTSSQPKNYKGRGEEFRAGAEKRRKHRRIEQLGDESDISSILNSPGRRSQSMSSYSSADESLASPSTIHSKHGRPLYNPKEKDIDNESTSSESHKSLSHLDQPPRAPHPAQPMDMMDQGICTDSPPDPHHHLHPVGDRSSTLTPAPPVPPPVRPVLHPTSAEICVQTEPIESMHETLPAAVVQSLEDYVTHMADDGVQTDVVGVGGGSGAGGGHLMTSSGEQQQQHLMPTGQAFQQQNQASQMMPSPSFHSTQPSTPYAPGPLSPGQMSHVGPRSVGPGPGSVSSLHDMQMSQESDMINQNAPNYVDSAAYDQHHYPTNQPTSTMSMSTTSPPSYQHYQQASPTGSQTSLHNVSSVPQQPYQDLRAPQTPTTPLAGAYIAPSPRAINYADQHPDSPLPGRAVMRTPMPPGAGVTYPDYTRAASVAPYPLDPTQSIRNSRSVAPSRYNESCELAQPVVQQQQQQHTTTGGGSKHHRRAPRDQGSQQQQLHHQQSPLSMPAAYQQAVAGHPSQQIFFHHSYPGYGLMSEPHAAFMQQDPTAMKNLEHMTRGLPGMSQQHQQQQVLQQQSAAAMAAVQYGHHAAAVGGGGRSQSQSRQQVQQHQQASQAQHVMQQLPSGMGMPPNPYHYMGKQPFPGQSGMMNPAQYVNPAFFGSPVPMSGPVPGYGRGQTGVASQGQAAMYSPYQAAAAQFYPSGAPQHPHAGGHTSMR